MTADFTRNIMKCWKQYKKEHPNVSYKEYRRRYVNSRNRLYYKVHPKYKKHLITYNKNWRKNNKDKVIKMQKNFKKTHPNYQKNWIFKYTYGIDKKTFKKMISLQNHKCAICQKKFNYDNRLNIPCLDHNHLTNKIRAVICWGCNAGIGFLIADNDESILLNAVKYVRKYQKE
jgi:hypothetical protein